MVTKPAASVALIEVRQLDVRDVCWPSVGLQGFGTTLTVAYHKVAPRYSTLAGALRELVTTSPTDMHPSVRCAGRMRGVPG